MKAGGPVSIQNQILIPIVIIQSAAVCAISVATATLAARRSDGQIVERVNGVVEALGRANFPYTRAVLTRMRGLSGAEFLAYDAQGRVQAASLPELERPWPALEATPEAAGLEFESLGALPTIELGGVRYVSARLPATGGSRGGALLVLYPETSWRQARRSAALPPLGLGGGALVLMVGVTGWTARRIRGRLQRVSLQVARIASGEFQGLDPGSDRDEISALVESINAMCLQLREMSRTIQRSERTRLLAQLAAGLAHQMRNALAGARMSLQLHARRCPNSSEDRSLDVALRQLAMIEEQLRGLLSLGQVERRPPARIDLSALIAEVALLVSPSGEHAGVTLEVGTGTQDQSNGEVGPREIQADAEGLRAAVLNLTVNAIEAAGQGGTVRIDALVEGDSARIEVSDDGPGPPPDLAEALFEPFTTGKPEGVGLGLALAQEFAERHGGSLAWFRDEDAGATRFVLRLPRCRDHPPNARDLKEIGNAR